MSHIFQIPDELYAQVADHAKYQGKTPEAFLLDSLAQILSQSSKFQLLAAKTLDPEDAFKLLEGIISVPVEPGWADDHDYYFAGGEYDDQRK